MSFDAHSFLSRGARVEDRDSFTPVDCSLIPAREYTCTKSLDLQKVVTHYITGEDRVGVWRMIQHICNCKECGYKLTGFWNQTYLEDREKVA
jgi:hypothetical protein